MEGLAGLDETLLEDKLEYLHFTTPPPLVCAEFRLHVEVKSVSPASCNIKHFLEEAVLSLKLL